MVEIPKILALDLSTTASGWCVGPAGGKPTAYGTIRPALDKVAAKSMASKFLLTGRAVSAMCKAHACDYVVAEELNSSIGMNTTRVLAQLAGAVMAILFAEQNKNLYFLNTSKARSAAGVDLGWHGEKKAPNAKQRVADCLRLRGIKVSNMDEADAAIILIASRLLLPEALRSAA